MSRKAVKWLTIILIMSTILMGCQQSKPVSTDTAVEAAQGEAHFDGKEDVSADPSQSTGSGADQKEMFYGLHKTGSVNLSYAQGFSIDRYGNDCALIDIPGSGRFLVVSEGAAVPTFPSEEDIVVLQKPLLHIYLASSSVMDFFRQLDALDCVKMTSMKENDWSLPEVRDKVVSGEISFVGKYNSPDYERLIDNGCDLAIENTMIYHNPEAKELIEKLGIPVLVERSSYEGHPLGRMEWIKLYGVLTGKEAEAASFFEEKLKALSEILPETAYGKKVAFFYITAGGYVNVRKPGDYIAKMIELAGGEYILSDLKAEEENASSTMNISMEEFYLRARDADILIYNSTIDGELETMEEFLLKDELLADFKAVSEGNVWCSTKDLFQEATGAADMIQDLEAVISGKEQPTLKYLHQLQ